MAISVVLSPPFFFSFALIFLLERDRTLSLKSSHDIKAVRPPTDVVFLLNQNLETSLSWMSTLNLKKTLFAQHQKRGPS